MNACKLEFMWQIITEKMCNDLLIPYGLSIELGGGNSAEINIDDKKLFEKKILEYINSSEIR